MKRRLGLVLALVFGFGCTKKSVNEAPVKSLENKILIGEVGSFTGDTATFGISTHQGIELATEKRNAEGGGLREDHSNCKIRQSGQRR